MSTIAIVQARMDSTRLAGKVLLPLGAYNVLHQVVRRLRRVEGLADVIVATTCRHTDKSIATYCREAGISYYLDRGDPSDVLSRYYHCASECEVPVDTIVRVTADCPLVDPEIVQQVMKLRAEHDVDHTHAAVWPWFHRARQAVKTGAAKLGMDPRPLRADKPMVFPDGFDVECFTFAALRNTWANALARIDRENVTSYYAYADRGFRCMPYWASRSWPDVCLSINTQDDYTRVAAIFDECGDAFTSADVYGQLSKVPAQS